MSSGSGGRYVPPHLRGRGDNGNTAKRNDTGNSRWKNLDNDDYDDDDERNGGHDQKRRNGYHRYNAGGGRKLSGNNSGTSERSSTGGGGSGSSSRWANVDRSAIHSGNPSKSRYNLNNNYSTSNSNSNSNRHHSNTSSSNFGGHNHHPPERHRRRRHHSEDHFHHDLSHAKAVFFGDSFIKLFGLLNEYADSIQGMPRPIEVHKYKAASAKGLTREGNENRDKILRTVDKIRNERTGGSGHHQHRKGNRAYQTLERLVFCFGSVDVHMSFYYKKFVQKKALSDDDLKAIAISYVDFVADLRTTGMDGDDDNDNDDDNDDKPSPSQQPPPLRKLIVGIYPSPLCDGDVGASLMAYGSLETDDQVHAVDASEDKSIESRQARVDLFNRALRDRCEHHNRCNHPYDKDHNLLEYWDIRDDLLTTDEDGRPKVRDAYKDVSDLNIHLIHETTLQLWVSKWLWYEDLTQSNEINSNNHRQKQQQQQSLPFLEYLQKTFDEYRKTKPWAERTHVAETRGVRLA